LFQTKNKGDYKIPLFYLQKFNLSTNLKIEDLIIKFEKIKE